MQTVHAWLLTKKEIPVTNHRWNSLPQPGANPAEVNPAESSEIWVIVVAGGSGSRYGGPKQYELLAGERVIDWSVAVASLCADGVVVVVSADADLALTRGELQVHPKIRAVVHGGASRSASVRHGLAAVPDSAAVIVVHDAARPLASPQLFTDAVKAIRNGAGAAVTAIPVVDTIKRTDGLRVTGTVDRANLVAVQTPQAFNAALLRRAHAVGSDATDDAGLVEALGATVVVVPGDVRNLKLTTPEDLIILEAFADGFDLFPGSDGSNDEQSPALLKALAEIDAVFEKRRAARESKTTVPVGAEADTEPTQALGATLGGRVTQAASKPPTNAPLENLGNPTNNTVRTSGSFGAENFAPGQGDTK
jgi:2-C-methyl-D-erythritol 4-phosphate cytidylyltransferase